MLELKTSTTRNAAGTELYIEFLDATGVFDAVNNPGGFGGDNPARNTLAILYLGYLKKSSGDVEVVPVTFDPKTVSSFTILTTESVQGHLESNLFAVPLFDDEAVYNEGDVVYNEDDGEVQKYVSAAWEAITIEDLLNEASIVQVAKNSMITVLSETFRNELLAEKVMKVRALIKKECGKDEYDDAKLAFDYVDSTLEAAILDFCSGAYAEAQLKIEEILDYQEQYNTNQ